MFSQIVVFCLGNLTKCKCYEWRGWGEGGWGGVEGDLSLYWAQKNTVDVYTVIIITVLTKKG